GEDAEFTLVVELSEDAEAGTLSNEASVGTSSADANSGNDSDATDADIEVEVDSGPPPRIGVFKSADAYAVEQGDEVTFEVRVLNLSRTLVTVTDLVDSVYGDLDGRGDCETGDVIGFWQSYECSFSEDMDFGSAHVHTNTATATVSN